MVDTTPKPFVFVLMPFDKRYDDVYQLGIKKACDNAGAYAERIDEQIFQESILQRIYNQISKADVILADMTGRNPNVFYETGYAHALGKQVILLTQDVNDIPFDLKHYPHIIYGGQIIELIPELEKRVKWAIEQAAKHESPMRPIIQFYVDKVSLVNEPTFEFVKIKPDPKEISIDLSCHNPDDNELRYVDFDIVFITSDSFSSVSSFRRLTSSVKANTIALPEGGFIHVLSSSYHLSLLLGGWESFSVMFTSEKPLHSDCVEPVTLRTLSGNGGCDYPFNISILPPVEKGKS